VHRHRPSRRRLGAVSLEIVPNQEARREPRHLRNVDPELGRVLDRSRVTGRRTSGRFALESGGCVALGRSVSAPGSEKEVRGDKDGGERAHVRTWLLKQVSASQEST
jgi:hypothetical protein